MAWKCKKCGESYFSEIVVSGTQRVEYDENGEGEDYWDLKLKMGDTVCNNCGNRGKTIKNIAEWEED